MVDVIVNAVEASFLYHAEGFVDAEIIVQGAVCTQSFMEKSPFVIIVLWVRVYFTPLVGFLQ